MEGKGFVLSGQLAIGNAIVTRAGPAVRLVGKERTGKRATVYNFEVAGTHTYFVGHKNGGLWVHNTSMPERLREFYRRLAELPPAESSGEALEQIRGTMNGVEDDLSGIPCEPIPGKGDLPNGRMYPPFNDSVHINPDGSLEGITKGHRIDMGSDGTIIISPRSGGDPVFTKPGGG